MGGLQDTNLLNFTLAVWPIYSWDRPRRTGGGLTRGRRRRGVNPDHCCIVIINRTGFDVHDTHALLVNNLGILILSNDRSPFDTCCVFCHLKPHQSTSRDFYLMICTTPKHYLCLLTTAQLGTPTTPPQPIPKTWRSPCGGDLIQGARRWERVARGNVSVAW